MFWLWCLVIGSFRAGAAARGVNISNAWFLPEESFPVFYRHFKEKATWNEAEAICSLHRANLMTVERSSLMDAATAYLKEIEAADYVWIDLQKKPADDHFYWGNGERVADDGYWAGAIPKPAEGKLCVALDPASDFRWTAFFCGGPQLASFVCELPVPDWAKNENGCMITSLPSLTVTLMPEIGVVQLFSDCGPEGTRRLACKGSANRDEIFKRLSCDIDAFLSTVSDKSTTAAVEDVRTKDDGYVSETTKERPAFAPQTRHRRGAGAQVDEEKTEDRSERTSSGSEEQRAKRRSQMPEGTSVALAVEIIKERTGPETRVSGPTSEFPESEHEGEVLGASRRSNRERVVPSPRSNRPSFYSYFIHKFFS